MENVPLSLILDVVILVMLVATIAYAVRLTGYLKRFQDSRADLEAIIKDLSQHIAKADKAVHNLNDSVEFSGNDLQKRLERAEKMFDELEFVVQTGDALANRLQDLATRNRRIVEGGESDLADLTRRAHRDEEPYDTRLENIVKKAERNASDYVPAPSSRPTFAIRDPELERGEPSDEGGFTLDDDMLSDAERDLYKALQNNKRTHGG